MMERIETDSIAFYLLIATHLFCSLESSACFSPPKTAVAPYQDLIKRTEIIVLAKAKRSQRVHDNLLSKGRQKKVGREKDLSIQFETIEVLKGTVGGSFEILSSSKAAPSLDDFDSHNDCRFWESGRTWNSSDCQIYPSFEEGVVYLIFLNEPYHWKSFEKIVNPEKDRWLAAVRSHLKGGAQKFECYHPYTNLGYKKNDRPKLVPKLPESHEK